MEIVWTDFAIEKLKNIFDYYSEKANKKVAHRIRKQIIKTTSILKVNPQSGQIEFNLEVLLQKHRYLVSGNYKIIYRVTDNQVIINDIFDTRQDPIKMKR